MPDMFPLLCIFQRFNRPEEGCVYPIDRGCVPAARFSLVLHKNVAKATEYMENF